MNVRFWPLYNLAEPRPQGSPKLGYTQTAILNVKNFGIESEFLRFSQRTVKFVRSRLERGIDDAAETPKLGVETVCLNLNSCVHDRTAIISALPFDVTGNAIQEYLVIPDGQPIHSSWSPLPQGTGPRKSSVRPTVGSPQAPEDEAVRVPALAAMSTTFAERQLRRRTNLRSSSRGVSPDTVIDSETSHL